MKIIAYLINFVLVSLIIAFILLFNNNINGIRIMLFSTIIAVVLLIMQSVKSFFYIKQNIQLKLLSFLINLCLSFCFILVFFKYGWLDDELINLLLYKLGVLFFVLTSIFLLYSIKTIKNSNYYDYFRYNILTSWLVIMIFGCVPIILSPKAFYNNFNFNEYKRMNYEHYISKDNYYVLYITSSSKFNLKEDANIIGEGVRGKIKNIKNNNNNYIFECLLEKGTRIPIDSKLYIVQTEKKEDQILVLPSKKSELYRDYDTLCNLFKDNLFKDTMDEILIQLQEDNTNIRIN